MVKINIIFYYSDIYCQSIKYYSYLWPIVTSLSKKDLKVAGVWEGASNNFRFNNFKILSWCISIFYTYFEPETIPYLYSILIGEVQKIIPHDIALQCEIPSFLGNALYYSQLYTTQCKNQKLTELSKLYDEWVSTNKLFYNCKETYFRCLMALQDYYQCKCKIADTN
eukprot:181217_1